MSHCEKAKVQCKLNLAPHNVNDSGAVIFVETPALSRLAPLLLEVHAEGTTTLQDRATLFLEGDMLVGGRCRRRTPTSTS